MPNKPDEAPLHTELGLGKEKAVRLDLDTVHLQDQPVVDISHDLRTQLATVTLLSGNLDLLYESLDEEKRRAMIKDLRKQMRALNALASELLLEHT